MDKIIYKLILIRKLPYSIMFWFLKYQEQRPYLEYIFGFPMSSTVPVHSKSRVCV